MKSKPVADAQTESWELLIKKKLRDCMSIIIMYGHDELVAKPGSIDLLVPYFPSLIESKISQKLSPASMGITAQGTKQPQQWRKLDA